jgi:hypothetical protein
MHKNASFGKPSPSALYVTMHAYRVNESLSLLSLFYIGETAASVPGLYSLVLVESAKG